MGIIDNVSGPPKNPRRGFCDWQYPGGQFCAGRGSFGSNTLGNDRWFCRGHLVQDPDHRGEYVQGRNWREERVEQLVHDNPQWQRTQGEDRKDYGKRMADTMRSMIAEVSENLASPAQDVPADETARKASIDRARAALGDEAMHDDLDW